jgi:hypothetical protein
MDIVQNHPNRISSGFKEKRWNAIDLHFILKKSWIFCYMISLVDVISKKIN